MNAYYATTDFEWLLKDSTDADSYNTILSWPAGQPEKATVLNASERDGIRSSRELHEKIKRSLISEIYPEGPVYFKIEGLASLPNNRLIFGVREIGESYENPVFKFILIEAVTKATDMDLEIDDFKVIYEYDTNENPNLEYPVGLSSIEYDQKRNGLFILTSYEVEQAMGGYLWFLPMASLEMGAHPQLVLKETGEPLQFQHKAEGLWILDDHSILVIHDEDRKEGPVLVGKSELPRKVNHGIFSRVDIQ